MAPLCCREGPCDRAAGAQLTGDQWGCNRRVRPAKAESPCPLIPQGGLQLPSTGVHGSVGLRLPRRPHLSTSHKGASCSSVYVEFSILFSSDMLKSSVVFIICLICPKLYLLFLLYLPYVVIDLVIHSSRNKTLIMHMMPCLYFLVFVTFSRFLPVSPYSPFSSVFVSYCM